MGGRGGEGLWHVAHLGGTAEAWEAWEESLSGAVSINPWV